MSDVTDADRDKALDIIAEHQHGDADPFGEIADAIAAALAEERAKAREVAYSEGAADALYGATAELLPHKTVPVAYLRAESDRIRRAIEEQQ